MNLDTETLRWITLKVVAVTAILAFAEISTWPASEPVQPVAALRPTLPARSPSELEPRQPLRPTLPARTPGAHAGVAGARVGSEG